MTTSSIAHYWMLNWWDSFRQRVYFSSLFGGKLFSPSNKTGMGRGQLFQQHTQHICDPWEQPKMLVTHYSSPLSLVSIIVTNLKTSVDNPLAPCRETEAIGIMQKHLHWGMGQTDFEHSLPVQWCRKCDSVIQEMLYRDLPVKIMCTAVSSQHTL